jgi:hypothetical protein
MVELGDHDDDEAIFTWGIGARKLGRSASPCRVAPTARSKTS